MNQGRDSRGPIRPHIKSSGIALGALCSFIPLPVYPRQSFGLATEPGDYQRGIFRRGRNLDTKGSISCARSLSCLPLGSAVQNTTEEQGGKR